MVNNNDTQKDPPSVQRNQSSQVKLKSFSVVLRANFQMPLKRPAHLLVTAETALLADQLQWQFGLLDFAAGDIETDLLDEVCRG